MLVPAQAISANYALPQLSAAEECTVSHLDHHSKVFVSNREVEEESIHNLIEEDDLEEDERIIVKAKAGDHFIAEIISAFIDSHSNDQYLNCICPAIGHIVNTQVSKFILFEVYRL